MASAINGVGFYGRYCLQTLGVAMNYIELAKQVGAVQNVLAMGRHDGVLFTETELEKFADLVEAAARADEREACAKLCDNRVEELYVSRDTVDCAEWLANEIRARGRA